MTQQLEQTTTETPNSSDVSPWRGHGARGYRRRAAGSGNAQGQTTENRPRLADGVTLEGEFEGSGYKEPHYMARRSNGALVQLTPLLHLVAEAANDSRSYEDIATTVSGEYGKTVSVDNVAQLVQRLRDLGILANADGSSPEVAPTDPLLALRLRTAVIPAHLTPRVARLMHPLFWPVIIAVAGAGLIAFDYWLFFVHGLSDSLRSTTQQPLVFLLVAGLIVVSAGLHELGHAAACSYGGARPGKMGAGLYLAWPAFYTDVTDAYRLDRKGRLRTDLGGVYLNVLVVLALAGIYSATHYAPLLLVCFISQIQIIQQMLPLLRLDGYYVLSDAVGVPDLYRRIGPIIRSVVPWKATEPEVHELRLRVRLAVTAWVLVIIPLLLMNFVFIVLSFPRIAATGWDSAARLWGEITGGHGASTSAAATVQLIFLVIPMIGILIMMGRLAVGGGRKLTTWSSGSPTKRTFAPLIPVMLAGLLAYAWWPDGRYVPYRQGESGTLQQTVADSTTVGTGSPTFRSPREAQQGLAPVAPGTSAVRTPQLQPAATPTPTPLASPGATSPASPAPVVAPGPASQPSPQSAPSPTTSPSPTASPSPSP